MAIKSRRIDRAYITRGGSDKIHTRDYLKDLGSDGRIILKWILKT
jgi:hypothetical protein